MAPLQRFFEAQPEIPPDFPREQLAGSISGATPKVLARRIGGRYVVGLTEIERHERYEACCDLVTQLVAYCERKQPEIPGLSDEDFYQRLVKGIHARGDFGASPDELQWVLLKLRNCMGWAFTKEN